MTKKIDNSNALKDLQSMVADLRNSVDTLAHQVLELQLKMAEQPTSTVPQPHQSSGLFGPASIQTAGRPTCRNWCKKNKLPYSDTCQECGSITREGWRCKHGLA
jgi:hypothetical protein